MAFSLAGVSAPCCCGSLFFLFTGLAAAGYGAKEYLLVQKIENTPTSKIRSAAVGLVEIKGKAKCKEPLTSPISRATCCYWHISAEYYQSSKHGGNWYTFYTDTSSKPFFIEDDTGKMLTDPSGGEVSIECDFLYQGNLAKTTLFGLLGVHQLDKKVLDFLEANPDAKMRFNSHSGQQLRVQEYFIAEGDMLYALGTAEPLPGAASSAHNENLILHKGRGEQFMFVSDSDEARIVGSRRLVALVSLFAGVAMSAAALLILLSSIFSLAL